MRDAFRDRGARAQQADRDAGAAPALLRRLAEGAQARAVTLAPSVGSDPEASDYLALFEVNVRRLTAALAGR